MKGGSQGRGTGLCKGPGDSRGETQVSRVASGSVWPRQVVGGDEGLRRWRGRGAGSQGASGAVRRDLTLTPSAVGAPGDRKPWKDLVGCPF